MGVARGCFFYKLNIFQKEGRRHENKEKKVFLSTVYVNTYFLYCSAGTLKQDNTVSYGQYFKIDNSELVKSRNCKTHARGMLTICVFFLFKSVLLFSLFKQCNALYKQTK